jgi:hypothetical protein
MSKLKGKVAVVTGAKLIGGRTQVRGGLLDRLGEIKILLALETIKHRGRLEGFLLDGVKNIHSRHGRPPHKVVPDPGKYAAGTNVSRKSLRWDRRLEANLNRKPNGLALKGPFCGTLRTFVGI